MGAKASESENLLVLVHTTIVVSSMTRLVSGRLLLVIRTATPWCLFAAVLLTVPPAPATSPKQATNNIR